MTGYKATKDRLTLLFGGSASGDIKLRPLLVYHSENPRAHKKNQGSLLLCGRVTQSPGITQGIFQDWFFSPTVSPKDRNITWRTSPHFNILLWLVSAPGHSPLMDSFHPIFKVVHLPLNTPVDAHSTCTWTIIATFKKYYLWHNLHQAVKLNHEWNWRLKQFWKDSNIYKAINYFFTSLGVRLLLSPWMGFGRTFAYSLFMIFLDEKVDRRVHLWQRSDPQRKQKLDLQEDNFIEFLAVNTRGLLMKTWWNWSPRGNNEDKIKKK